MTDEKIANFEDIRTWIEGRIQEFLPSIGVGGEGNDKYAEHKLFTLIGALEGSSEYDDIEQFRAHLLRLYRARKGGVDALHDLLHEMGVEHSYP